jgi:DegV family protein with EDD domain
MTGIRIVTDSACDVPDDVLAEHHIGVVPLTIRFGDEDLIDREELSPAEFWKRCETFAGLPETAAPSAGRFEELFRRLASEGAEGIVCVCISAELSATAQSAGIAAQSVADTIPVRVIDSRFVSLGQGLIVLAAAEAAGLGKGLDDVVAAAEDAIPRTRVFATLDTLENLRKGGRIGAAKAMIGSLLSFKPIIAVEDGVVAEAGRQRTRARSLRHLVDKVAEHGAVENVTVVHGQAADLEQFLDMLGEIHPRDRITTAILGPVVGTHAGPGTMGVAFQLRS